jgi:Uncharacterised nucleotidyltransferase
MRASFVQAARSLQLDLTAAEVGTALAESDVSCILVRGPSLTRWLYPQNQGRNYIDVDLLVSPDRFGTAERALESLGFAHVPTMMQRSDDRPVHARTWYREADSAAVDLHRTIIGARAADAVVWDTLSRETESIQVGGRQLEGLNAAATALVVALHVAQHGRQTPKPLDDLRQALERLPQATWKEAARLARQLDATESFGLGLRLLPGGKSLADDLGLPVILTAEGMLRSRTPPPTALGFEWLTHVPGTRAKARLLAGKLVPDTEFMHAWSPLARRGTLGLALAYLWRPLWLAWHAPRGYLAWISARRKA